MGALFSVLRRAVFFQESLRRGLENREACCCFALCWCLYCLWHYSFLTFDSHDMWHLLSAIALALWVLVLLEAQTRIFKRRLPVVLPSLQQHLRNAQCPSTVVLPVVLPSWPSQAPAAQSPSGAASFSVGDPHPTNS